MTAQVAKWGNSLAVRLPVPVAGNLGLVEGSTVKLAAKAPLHSTAASGGGFAEDHAPYAAGLPLAIEVKLGKWGNSLAVRLPRALVGELGVSEGSAVRLTLGASGVLDIARELTLSELLEAIKSLRGLIPADYKFDREEANARVPHERD